MWRSMCALAAVAVTAAVADNDPFSRGRCRELFISGLPQAPADLAAWAAAGVTCAYGAKPAEARAHKLSTRGWFTLNYMDSRSHDEAWIRARAAIREDGSYLRPYDPLFPTVGQFGWSACVNNPLWLETARELFRGLAQAGHDGVHVDFASHYEPCFCAHCRTRWTTFAQGRKLAATELAAAAKAADLPTRAGLQEFRIRCVMDFLADLRRTARAIRPVFALDGTYHQDSGSAYQWAYGDHFDLMCIEGTTHGPFPPEGTQLPWLKVAHALSEHDGRRPAAMSVTYHLLTDAKGEMHHGRMAADRLRVALAEIVSQGAVSWLGLGGPKTGNLLKEHQSIVKAYYALARDLEPELAEAQEPAEIGLLFSARSYLISSSVHRQCLAFAHTLQKAHVPYRVVSDVGLDTARLRDLSGLIVLDAPALSNAACATLAEWLRGGGQALVMGANTARYAEDWSDRAPRPEWAVPPEGKDPIRRRPVGNGAVSYWVEDAFAGASRGANQVVSLAQTAPAKLAIEGWSKAEEVGGSPDAGYALYVDLQHQDGSPVWGQVARFRTGTHDWEFQRTIISSDKPFKSASVHLLFRNHSGRAWFRDVRFGVWDEQKQQITRNLLNPVYHLPKGEHLAAAGADAKGAVWSPYGGGYEVENLLDLGLWVRCDGSQTIGIPSMVTAPAATEARLLTVLAPLRAAQPLVTLTGPGSDRVTVDLQRAGERLLVHLINHGAELHPQLGEAEQQAQDRTTATSELVLRVRVPGMRLDPSRARVRVPEGTLDARVAAHGEGLEVRLPGLRQYAVVLVK